MKPWHIGMTTWLNIVNGIIIIVVVTLMFKQFVAILYIPMLCNTHGTELFTTEFIINLMFMMF